MVFVLVDRPPHEDYCAANSSRAYDSRYPQESQRKVPMGMINFPDSLVPVQNDFAGAPAPPVADPTRPVIVVEDETLFHHAAALRAPLR